MNSGVMISLMGSIMMFSVNLNWFLSYNNALRGKVLNPSLNRALLSKRSTGISLVMSDPQVSGNPGCSECLVSVLGGGASKTSQSA